MFVTSKSLDIDSYENTVTHLLTKKEYEYSYCLYKNKIITLKKKLHRQLPDDPIGVGSVKDIKFEVTPVEFIKNGWRHCEEYKNKTFSISWIANKWKFKNFSTKREVRKYLTYDKIEEENNTSDEYGYHIKSEEFPSLYFLDNITFSKKDEVVNPWVFDTILFSELDVDDKEIIHSVFEDSYLADPFIVSFKSILQRNFHKISRDLSDNLFRYQFSLSLR